jgi:hypothetical protein
MTEEAGFQWPMLLLPLAVLCYFELLRRLDRRWSSRTPLTDAERLAILARRRAVSEHEIFHLAAEGWTVAGTQVESDFKAYLNDGDLPHYVRDYLRRQKIALPEPTAPRSR